MNHLDAARQAYIRELFLALEMTAYLRAPSDPSREAPVMMADLYAYATRSRCADAERIERALRTNRRLRADFELLLRRLAVAVVPRLAAAASGAVRRRHSRGCEIRIASHPARPLDSYVVIEFKERMAAPPRTMFVWKEGSILAREDLPAMRESTMQLFARGDSELVHALQDGDSEIVFA